MTSALDQGEFHLEYQPQMDMGTGVSSRFEALLRWPKGPGPYNSPGLFIPLAEKNGFILELGRWVLAQAVRDLLVMKKRGKDLQVSVNVSPLQLQDREFAAFLAGLLESQGDLARSLELEITESLDCELTPTVLGNIEFCRSLGCRISLDDFGVGFSDHNRLRLIRPHTLKIDRFPVSRMMADENSFKFIEVLIGYARYRGIKVVAEGVETPEEAGLLKKLGCDILQGFWIGRSQPMESYFVRGWGC